MQNFDTLFGPDLDYQKFSCDLDFLPPPVDTSENLTRLANLEHRDVSMLHYCLGEGMCGRTRLQRLIDSEVLRKKGNDLYAAGKNEEALKVYEEGIAVNPYDVRFFTNAAICLIALDRNEEANAMAVTATDVEHTPKAYLLMTKSLCNLGYVQLAKEKLKEMDTSFLPKNFVEEAEKLMNAVPRARRRKMDARDLVETERRLLSGEELSPLANSFLLHHYLQYFRGRDETFLITFPFYFKCFIKSPLINSLVMDPSSLSELSYGTYRLLGNLLLNLQLAAEIDPSLCLKLVKEPCFVKFMSAVGRVLVRKDAISSAMTRCGPSVMFTSFFGCYFPLLALLANDPSIRTKIFKTTPPLNDAAFYAMLMVFCPVLFDTTRSPKINKMVGSFSSVMAEPWCLDKFETDIKRADYVLSLLASLSTIYLQSLPVNERVFGTSPYVSFFPFWVAASRRSRIAEVMARRPGVWSHLSIRLNYAVRDLDTYETHHDHLHETLRVINRLVQLLPTPAVSNATIAVNKGSRNRLIYCFTTLLRFDYTMSRVDEEFGEKYKRLIFKMLTKFIQWAPQFFAKDFLEGGNKKVSNLSNVALTAATSNSRETSSTAIEFVNVLIDHATSNQSSQLTGNKKVFPKFVAKLVAVLAPPAEKTPIGEDLKKAKDEKHEKLSHVVIEILLKLLGNVTDKESSSAKENALLQNLLNLNPTLLVEALARLVQQSGAAEQLDTLFLRSALSLIASLVALDGTFEEAVKKLNEELASSLMIALQKIIEGQSQSDQENSSLQRLVSIITK